MTEQEAIKFLTGYLDSVVYKEKCVEAHKLAIKALEEIQKYRVIGTPEECRQAMEKQKAKKPIQITSTKKDGKIGKCPCCESIIGEDMIWCDDCGQKLDWGDEDDN